MAKELPEMDTDKEVHVQDGEEHVAFNSMAASGVNGDAGNENQGEEPEEGSRPAAIVAAAAGASYLHPLVLEESESDSDDETWITHPSSSPPEGSLLHALNLQLLGAGHDIISVREVLRSRVHIWGGKAFDKPVGALAEPEMESDEMHHLQIPPRAETQDDDGSHGEQLQQQMTERVPRRHRGAAKKTSAADVGSSRCSSRSRPLPVHIGVRINTPRKKNKGYLKNRLQ